MISLKLLWGGLTFIEAATLLNIIPSVAIVGAVLMVIGVILLWLDK